MMCVSQFLRVRATAFRTAELRSTGQIVCKVESNQDLLRSDRSSRHLRRDMRTFVITLVTVVTMVLWLLWLPLLP